MNYSRSFFSLAVFAALFPSTMFASPSDLQAEYAQVRKIAMKDAGVRAAFEKADAKLKAKMIEIDPSLKSVVEKGGVAPTPIAKKPAAKKPLQGGTANSSSYVVAKGDTLTSIAARYGVKVDDLKSANGIADERKLQVGQTLRIPAHSSATHSAKAQPATKNDDNLWTRLKGGF